MHLFIFITVCITIASGSPQYYYVQQPALYHVPRPYNTFSNPFSTYHVNPHYQQHQQYQQFRTVPPPIPATPTPVHRTEFAQSHDAEYRGFAYHTRTDNGATSHVLFVTGPQAQQVNSRVFNNFNSPVFGHQARTFASEMVDPVKETEPEVVTPKNIQNDPFEYFRTFFRNHDNPGLINFYSKDTNLFAEQVPGYPANVVPLITTEKPEEQKQEKEVAAESIISNTRFKLDNFVYDQEKRDKNNKTKTNVEIIEPHTQTPIDILLVSSTMLPYTEGANSALPITQRALEDLEGLSSPSTPTTSSSTSTSTTTLSTLGGEGGTSPDKALFLSQRFGNQPETLADTSVNVYPTPSSSESVSSTSETSSVASMQSGSSERYIVDPKAATYDFKNGGCSIDQTDADLILANTVAVRVVSQNVEAKSSCSGSNTKINLPVNKSTSANTSLLSSSSLEFQGTSSPNSIILETTTDVTTETYEGTTTIDQDSTTTESIETTTIQGKITTMFTSLVTTEEEGTLATDTTAVDSNLDATTENILTTTDTLMTTTTQ